MKRALLVLLFFPLALAGDDPGIPKATKERVFGAIQTHIEENAAASGVGYRIFDAEKRAVVALELAKIHAGVVRKGDGDRFVYVSCADFKTRDGGVFDVDVIVSPDFVVLETLIHKRNQVRSHRDREPSPRTALRGHRDREPSPRTALRGHLDRGPSPRTALRGHRDRGPSPRTALRSHPSLAR